MKLKLVSVESGITATGFRRIAAVAKASAHEVEVCFVPIDNRYRTLAYMFPYSSDVLDDSDWEPVARYLADADTVAFSSVTLAKGYVEPIIKCLRQLNPKCKIIWGGAHPTFYPEDALDFADSICRGVGEQWMADFLGVKDIPAHSFQGYDCVIYDSRVKEFTPLTPLFYAIFNGTFFRTLFTTGCPYSCVYCANDALVKLDPEYRKIRHPGVPWLIEEVKIALATYPFITVIGLDDDNFSALPLETIREFCEAWQQEIKMPFVIYGMHPNTVTPDKTELLCKAGMRRMRMGIQSGSEKTLEFYNRTTPPRKIWASANTLIRTGRKYNAIPPAFDIMSDNPLEAPEEVWKTLQMVRSFERPYTLTVFSLRAYPGTKLASLVQGLPQTSYIETRPTMDNILFYLMATVNLPHGMFLWLMDKYQKTPQQRYPLTHRLVKFIYAVVRGMGHMKRGDFSRLGGKWGYYVWAIKRKVNNFSLTT